MIKALKSTTSQGSRISGTDIVQLYCTTTVVGWFGFLLFFKKQPQWLIQINITPFPIKAFAWQSP